MTALRLTYYPDITQYRTPAEVRSAIEEFAAALQKELCTQVGKPLTVTVLPVVSVLEQMKMAVKRECEIALMRPSAYIYAHRSNSTVEVATIAQREINGKVTSTYFAQIYVNRLRLDIHSFSELLDRCRKPLSNRPTLGFGDSFSTSNFLVNAALLKDNGIQPFTRFRKVKFFGGHDRVAKAVYEGRADVGAGHDGVIHDLARQEGYEHAADVLRTIGLCEIASDPVVVIVDDDELRAKIQRALVTISGQEPAKKAIADFWGGAVGLAAASHEEYKSIEKAIDGLGFSEADVLGDSPQPT